MVTLTIPNHQHLMDQVQVLLVEVVAEALAEEVGLVQEQQLLVQTEDNYGYLL